jgi:hypothetical protein
VGGDLTWFPAARKAPPLGTKRGDGTKTWVGVGGGGGWQESGGRRVEGREGRGGEGRRWEGRE